MGLEEGLEEGSIDRLGPGDSNEEGEMQILVSHEDGSQIFQFFIRVK